MPPMGEKTLQEAGTRHNANLSAFVVRARRIEQRSLAQDRDALLTTLVAELDSMRPVLEATCREEVVPHRRRAGVPLSRGSAGAALIASETTPSQNPLT